MASISEMRSKKTQRQKKKLKNESQTFLTLD
jgi:hypothetical protein